MKTAVRFFSRGGNTQKLALAIAGAVDAQPKPIPEPITEKTDLLFLGASIYAGGVDAAVRNYINTLDPSMVGEVVVFSTAAIKTSAFAQMQKLLMARGLRVSDREFHCRGQFTALHRGRPNADDLAQAKAFASQFMQQGVAK